MEQKLSEHDRKEQELEESRKVNRMVLITIVAVAVIALLIYGYGQVNYPHQKEISGVMVYSKVPFSDMAAPSGIWMESGGNSSVFTCKMELAAVFGPSVSGKPYKVYVEQVDSDEKPPVIHIEPKTARIEGEGYGLLNACHVFVCMMNNISCPEDFSEIYYIMKNSKNMNIVLGSDVYGAGIRGYTEIMTSLGAMQRLNNATIRSYLKEGDVCKLSTEYHLFNTTKKNITTTCNIHNAIYVQNSDKNEIRVSGDKIFVTGDEDHIYASSIIVRDIIAPSLIESMYEAE